MWDWRSRSPLGQYTKVFIWKSVCNVVSVSTQRSTGPWNASRSVGVIVPIKQQQASSATRWARVDPGVVVTVASPYDDPSRLVAAAEELRRAGVTLVVMECQGFTGAMKQVVRDVTGAPALLPTSVLARFLAELA